MELLPQDGGASHRLADGSSAPADVDCDHAIERCSDGPGRGKHNPLNPEGAFSGLTDGNPTPTLAPTGSISTPSDIDCDQAVERCSDDQELAKHDPLNPEGEFKLEFNTALNEVEKIDSSSKVNVKEAILGYPLIVQNAALNVTALPTTQGSVERLFSALQIIRSDFRSSMEEDIFQAVLFLRANSM
ncbi:unnamed protein product [Lymnaea stagnalis]|uniref:HAT C-terminal dimerisation domain-containing protein n=1 Tax=Lymnaea stagnalis TaxID=6523 RepID=A0AAV2IR22_LYMST